MRSNPFPPGYRRVHHHAPWSDANGNGDYVSYVNDDTTAPMAGALVIVVIIFFVDVDDASSNVAA